jgi:hypothetical protein
VRAIEESNAPRAGFAATVAREYAISGSIGGRTVGSTPKPFRDGNR